MNIVKLVETNSKLSKKVVFNFFSVIALSYVQTQQQYFIDDDEYKKYYSMNDR